MRQFKWLRTSVAEPKLFIFGSDSGSTFVHIFGSDSGSSSCHILPLKTLLSQMYQYVSLEVFLHPSILQTDNSKYLLKR